MCGRALPAPGLREPRSALPAPRLGRAGGAGWRDEGPGRAGGLGQRGGGRPVEVTPGLCLGGPAGLSCARNGQGPRPRGPLLGLRPRGATWALCFWRSGLGEGPAGSGAQGWGGGHPRCARAQRPVLSPAPCSRGPGGRIITAENSVYCSLLIRKIPEAHSGEFGKCGEV